MRRAPVKAAARGAADGAKLAGRAEDARAGERILRDRAARGAQRGPGRGGSAGVGAEVGRPAVAARPSEGEPLEGDEGRQREEDHEGAGGQGGGGADAGQISATVAPRLPEGTR